MERVGFVLLNTFMGHACLSTCTASEQKGCAPSTAGDGSFHAHEELCLNENQF